MNLTVSDIERFHQSYIPVPESGCYLWEKALVKGVAKFAVRASMGKILTASRVSWTLVNGVIPDGLLVLHKCDNPSCVRPDHLFLGTHKDNHQDRERKNRHPHSPEASSDLTRDQVLAIYGFQGPRKQTAEYFGVSEVVVSHIWNRKSWTKGIDLPKRDGRLTITEEKVLAIYLDCDGSQTAIGKRHGVGQGVVNKIKLLKRKRYRQIINNYKGGQ